jgi:ABC-type branched-subunit amino acid transport system substrate-binding protein
VLAALEWINTLDEFAPGGGFIVDGQRYKIKLIEYDDRTDTKRAALGETYLIDQHGVNMIIGPFSSPSTLAAQPIGQQNQVLNITWSVADDSTRPEMTYTWSHAMQGKCVGLYESAFHKNVLEAKSVAIITENEAYTQSVRKALTENWEKLGIEVVADEVFEGTVKDFSTVISRARKEDPDFLYVNGKMQSGILICGQLWQAGWNVLKCGNPDFTQDDQFAVNGPAAEGLINGGGFSYWSFAEDRVPQGALERMGSDRDLVLRQGDYFIEMWGEAHLVRMFYGWNGFRAYINAMMKAGTVDDGPAIRDAMEGLVWKDAQKTFENLPNHRVADYRTMNQYHESDKADKYDILGICYHTDKNQDVWVWELYQEFPTAAEWREILGY